MRFTIRLFHTQKDGNSPEEYEDAYEWSPKNKDSLAETPRLRVAVSDGASESAFVKEWARLLVRDFVTRPYRSPPALLRHTEKLALKWKEALSDRDLPWYAEHKMQMGAYATFLGFTLAEVQSECRWYALALGDSCLLHIRDDALLMSWPVRRHVDFSNEPPLLSTNISANSRILESFQFTEGSSVGGDVFLLATDAFAEWLLREALDDGRPWEHLFSFEENADNASRNSYFLAWVNDLRENARMRNDDVTCLIVRLQAD